MLMTKRLCYNKNMKNRFKRGFTLIELSFSLVFIGILSIAIALIIRNTIATYRRGMTLNKINTVGMDLVDELRTTVQSSYSSSLRDYCEMIYMETPERSNCDNDNGHNFITVERLASVKDKAKDVVIGTDVPVFGAFCTGSYSYIWNSGYFISDKYEVTGLSPATLKYVDINGNTQTYSGLGSQPFRLIKIPDSNRSVCISATLGKDSVDPRYSVEGKGNSYTSKINNAENSPTVFDITWSVTTDGDFQFSKINSNDIIEIIDSSRDNDLALYDLWASNPARSIKGLFYSSSFILGTLQGGINVKATGNFCATPNDYADSNFDYCAINKFNFAVQAIGG